MKSICPPLALFLTPELGDRAGSIVCTFGCVLRVGEASNINGPGTTHDRPRTHTDAASCTLFYNRRSSSRVLDIQNGAAAAASLFPSCGPKFSTAVKCCMRKGCDKKKTKTKKLKKQKKQRATTVQTLSFFAGVPVCGVLVCGDWIVSSNRSQNSGSPLLSLFRCGCQEHHRAWASVVVTCLG